MHFIKSDSQERNLRMPLFDIKRLSHTYPDGQKALSDISLKIYHGDRIALVGHNGSGKTTLMKHFNGLILPGNDFIKYKDKCLSGHNLDKVRQEVGILFQDPDDHLFCNSLYEDVAFGPMCMGMSKELVDEKVKKALKEADLLDLIYKPAQQLSYGQKKRAAFAAVMAMNPSVLILDEPSANLDPCQEKIFKQVLKDYQGTLICINHDLLFLYGLCERAVVLSKGMVHHDFSFNDLVSHPASLRGHGLDFSFRFRCCSGDHHHHFPTFHAPDESFSEKHSQSNSMIELKNYSYRYQDGSVGLDSINLAIMQGENIALVGQNGAGKSTLAKVLLGIIHGQGEYYFKTKPVLPKKLHDLWQRIGIIFQDSADQLFCPTCWDEVAFGPQQQGCSEEEVNERVKLALEQVNLEGYDKRVPLNLSGGERKRLAIAAVISMQPEVLILDEPTAGLDPIGEELLLEILLNIPITFILISHDIFFIKNLTKRTIVIHQGQIIRDYPTLEFLTDSHLESVNKLDYTYKNDCCDEIMEMQNSAGKHEHSSH